MKRYSVSQPELETICLMALRDLLGVVRNVCVSSVSSCIWQCNWEVRNIDPAPQSSRRDEVNHRIEDLKATFQLDPTNIDTGHGGFIEICKPLLH